MRVPRSWLEEFVELHESAGEIGQVLDSLGFEVEGIECPGAEITGVIAARIDAVLPHPDADRLQLADVSFGEGTTRVVCGAPNIAPGMMVPLARSGATLPGGFRLDRRKIRGIESDGMLCSARELGLGEDHGGILELPADVALGDDVRQVLGIEDSIFDLSITPNRPDAMSVIGIARELAAAFGRELRVPLVSGSELTTEAALGASVTTDIPERCTSFCARVVEVSVAQSPMWMQARLRAAGMRPINNVVDVTNYVLLEMGRPLHAFDLDKLDGNGLHIRAANDGEQIETLDGEIRSLTSSDIVVADIQGAAHAIAGVMGGAAAEVSDSTRRILLESAYFAPMSVGATAKRLHLRSEASARFERGIDPNSARIGADRAVELLESIAAGVAVPGHVGFGLEAIPERRIVVRGDRVSSIIGVPIGIEEVARLVAPLGILEGRENTEANAANFVVPTWRPDLEREIDIIEEVARRIGLDSIPRHLPVPRDGERGLTQAQRERRLLEDVLVGAGLQEAITLPLVNPTQRTQAGWGADSVMLANPLRSEESALRATLLPGLLAAAGTNVSQGYSNLRLFEIGRVFGAPTAMSAPLPEEHDSVAVLICGSEDRTPLLPARPVDVSDAVGALADVMAALRIDSWELRRNEIPPGFDLFATAEVWCGNGRVGTVGGISPTTAAKSGVTAPAFGFELHLAALFDSPRRSNSFQAFSKFPPARFDLAFVVGSEITAAEVESALRAGLEPLETEVRCFDRYEAVEDASTYSLAFAIELRDPSQTLSDTQIQSARERAIDSVSRHCGGSLRA